MKIYEAERSYLFRRKHFERKNTPSSPKDETDERARRCRRRKRRPVGKVAVAPPKVGAGGSRSGKAPRRRFRAGRARDSKTGRGGLPDGAEEGDGRGGRRQSGRGRRARRSSDPRSCENVGDRLGARHRRADPRRARAPEARAALPRRGPRQDPRAGRPAVLRDRLDVPLALQEGQGARGVRGHDPTVRTRLPGEDRRRQGPRQRRRPGGHREGAALPEPLPVPAALGDCHPLQEGAPRQIRERRHRFRVRPTPAPRLPRPRRDYSPASFRQGEVWHALRTKLTGELTSRRTLLAFLPELNAIADDLLRLVSAGADARGNVARFDELASRYGIETCCTLVLGRRMSFMESEISATARQLGDAMNRRFLSERDSFYRSSVDAYVSSPDYLKFLESEDVIHRIISNIVEESKASDGQGADDNKCILTSIVGRRDLDEREKHSALVDFIAAGISTLSSSLTFLFYLLSKNPAAQTKIREELEEIAPNRSHVTAADLGEMNYAKACMLEAFRLVPVAFALTRVLEEDAPLGGYLVPAGTLVMCHTMIACRDERNFERAGEFRPERWLEADGRGRGATTCVFAPFGIGKRMCPGKRLVEQAILITLAKTVRDYVIEFDGEIDVQFEFVLAPKTPVAFRFRQRR